MTQYPRPFAKKRGKDLVDGYFTQTRKSHSRSFSGIRSGTSGRDFTEIASLYVIDVTRILTETDFTGISFHWNCFLLGFLSALAMSSAQAGDF